MVTTIIYHEKFNNMKRLSTYSKFAVLAILIGFSACKKTELQNNAESTVTADYMGR